MRTTVYRKRRTEILSQSLLYKRSFFSHVLSLGSFLNRGHGGNRDDNLDLKFSIGRISEIIKVTL